MVFVVTLEERKLGLSFHGPAGRPPRPSWKFEYPVPVHPGTYYIPAALLLAVIRRHQVHKHRLTADGGDTRKSVLGGGSSW